MGRSRAGAKAGQGPNVENLMYEVTEKIRNALSMLSMLATGHSCQYFIIQLMN